MPKFRKKPVIIEARRVPPYGHEHADDARSVMQWMRDNGCECREVPLGIIIPTLEGDHRADPGDWIIRGVAGEFYPCKPGIFEATYEPVDEAPVGA